MLSAADSGIRQQAVRRRRAAAPCLLLLAAIGCGVSNTSDSAGDSSPSADAIRSEVERGPVKVILEVSPRSPRLSDEPQLTVLIRSEPGVRIEKPPFGTALGDFLIRDFQEPVPGADGQTQVLRQVYTLEPTRAGKLTIAPITFRFHDERPDGDGQTHTLESEALTVEVSTVLGDAAPSLADLRPAAGPVELPAGGSHSGQWLAGMAVLLAVAGAVVWKVRRLKTPVSAPLSPQELAWLELEQVVERRLAESDIKAYYVELTGVVRRYIERSTAVSAPEQTTEEFLREIVQDAVFADEDQRRLQQFLESADLVKFAALEPAASDIEDSFERAKEFIRLQREETQEVAV
ncbi:MAG: BatD family protein [Planctomycetaceae bacterium]